MKKIVLAFVFVLSSIVVFSQNNYFTLQTGNVPVQYTSLQAAVNAAVSGDTIYLNAGSKNIGTTTINKEVHLIGVGHYPDTSLASGGRTQLNGDLKLITGASHGSVSGFYLNGSLLFGNSSNDSISGFLIEKCHIDENLKLWYSAVYASKSNNIAVSKCVLNVIYINEAQNVLIKNSIIYGNINHGLNNVLISNNIFLKNNSTSPSNSIIYYVDYCTFQNNIFLQFTGSNSMFSYNSNNNTFTNNIIVSSNTNLNDVNSTGNLSGISQASIFVNQSGYNFDYNHNYHLKPGFTGVGYGTDGTDVGIYGGSDPYTDGALPSVPHFQSVNIGNQTNSNGQLPINITISAQD